MSGRMVHPSAKSTSNAQLNPTQPSLSLSLPSPHNSTPISTPKRSTSKILGHHYPNTSSNKIYPSLSLSPPQSFVHCTTAQRNTRNPRPPLPQHQHQHTHIALQYII